MQSNLSHLPVLQAIEPRSEIRDDSTLKCKDSGIRKPVYSALAVHQREETDWDFHEVAAILDHWYEILNSHFGLGLLRVPLRLDPAIRRNCAGYFRPGYNELGLLYEIAVAVPPVEENTPIDLGDTIGTLLHEMLHLEQELTGTPGKNNYHNRQYRKRACEYGLLVDYRGHQSYAPESEFLNLLRRNGVALPMSVQMTQSLSVSALPIGQMIAARRKSRSTLTKWSCGCTNVWVGVSVLHALCTRPDCGRPFARC